MSEKDGGPAFPQISTEIGQQYEPHISSSGGISKLEWFAGMALIATYMNGFAGPDSDERAIRCYDMAEAMIAELERRKS